MKILIYLFVKSNKIGNQNNNVVLVKDSTDQRWEEVQPTFLPQRVYL